ncbi:hypothetical protein BJY04DRAFT_191638 [Aspergillus karnatakaensis]|uniref:FAD-binding oxidoreductase n=1 Tax=Aspergillus karnatakaensis TaxID=1810916 RepID=UPI003CCCA920
MLGTATLSVLALLASGPGVVRAQVAQAQVQVQEPLQFDLPIAVANSTAAGCQQACAALEEAPTDDPTDLTPRYFVVQQQELTPLCVVYPESAGDVSRAVQVVKEYQCPFSVRSGGHGNHAGVSSIQGGLVIDTSRLKSITISEDESTVGLGAGLRWKEVYAVLEQRGLMVIGGRTESVGVSGFTLGGGMSFLSRRHGWALDNVRNYELVLANGTIANVNKTSSPDLFFALRGGGNNFGIVTRFDFETFRQGTLLGGTTVWILKDLESRLAALGLQDPWRWSAHSLLSRANRNVFKALGVLGFATDSKDAIREFVALADEKQTDAGAHAFMFLSWVPNLFGYFSGMTTMYSGPDASPAVFRNITALPKVHSTVRRGNMSDFVNEIEGQNDGLRDKRNIWRTATLKVDAELISDVFDIFLSNIHPYTTIPNLLLSTNLQLLTKHEIGLFARNGGNALGIRPEDGPLFFFSINFGYYDAADDERLTELAHRIMSQVAEQAKERGLFHPFIYQNYAGAGQEVYAGYGAENRARLAEIRERYDPEGVFWKLQPGYFKV